MNNQTSNQGGLQVVKMEEKRHDMADNSDLMSVKLKEQIAIMKKKQAALMKELEEIDRIDGGISQSTGGVSQGTKKEPNATGTGANIAADKGDGKKGKQPSKGGKNKKNAADDAPLPTNTALKQAKSAGVPENADNFMKKANDMNIKLFEMQERVRQKEMDKVTREQEEKLFRYKKEKELLTKQTEKLKTDMTTKNARLKEQIERARIAKEQFGLKQTELAQIKDEKVNEVRKIETKGMQVQYDIEIQLGDLAQSEGGLNGMKLQLRQKDNELKTLQENTRVETIGNQKLIDSLGETKKETTKFEFDAAKLRDDRDRLVQEIERKNEINNKRYTALFEAVLQIQAQISEKQAHIAQLSRVKDKTRLQNLEIKADSKVLETKIIPIPKFLRKIAKRDKQIFELEAQIECQKKEKRVEIVEKIIEKPIVIDKPVVVEKPVVVREVIRINEPVQLEIVRVKSELNNLNRANNEMTNEVDYWRKKCLDREEQCKQRESQLRLNFENERLIISEKIAGNDQQIRDINSRLQAMYTEVQTLYKANIQKNSHLSNLLQDVYGSNANIQQRIIASSAGQLPPPRVIQY